MREDQMIIYDTVRLSQDLTMSHQYPVFFGDFFFTIQ